MYYVYFVMAKEQMVNLNRKVTAVVINYQTPDLTKRAIDSIRAYYPHLSLLLIDNDSKDRSSDVLQYYHDQTPTLVRLVRNDRNLFHGPAMHQALQLVTTDFVLFLDSDSEITEGGFIESMLDRLESDASGYAIGKLVYMNKRGYDIAQSDNAIPYIRPICMLVRRQLYLTLPPFHHHGTPCLDNMRQAVAQGYQLIDFPVFDYIVHKGRGTAGRYGYGLGLKSKIDYILNKLGL